MHYLLNVYKQGLVDLGGNPKWQHLVVVYTKGDDLWDRLADWTHLRYGLADDTLDHLAQLPIHLSCLRRTSDELRQFTWEGLQASQFVNMAQEFRSVEYTMVSALGVLPQGDRLGDKVKPWGVLDPLLWMMEKSLSPWQKFWDQVKSQHET